MPAFFRFPFAPDFLRRWAERRVARRGADWIERSALAGASADLEELRERVRAGVLMGAANGGWKLEPSAYARGVGALIERALDPSASEASAARDWSVAQGACAVLFELEMEVGQRSVSVHHRERNLAMRRALDASFAQLLDDGRLAFASRAALLSWMGAAVLGPNRRRANASMLLMLAECELWVAADAPLEGRHREEGLDADVSRLAAFFHAGEPARVERSAIFQAAARRVFSDTEGVSMLFLSAFHSAETFENQGEARAAFQAHLRWAERCARGLGPAHMGLWAAKIAAESIAPRFERALGGWGPDTLAEFSSAEDRRAFLSALRARDAFAPPGGSAGERAAWREAFSRRWLGWARAAWGEEAALAAWPEDHGDSVGARAQALALRSIVQAAASQADVPLASRSVAAQSTEGEALAAPVPDDAPAPVAAAEPAPHRHPRRI
jgi:hypothetical protein